MAGLPRPGDGYGCICSVLPPSKDGESPSNLFHSIPTQEGGGQDPWKISLFFNHSIWSEVRKKFLVVWLMSRSN